MKKISIQVKIGLLLIIAIILLSATCFLAYRNLSAIAASIQVKLNPEPQLESIRQISHELSTADNSIRFYTISRDTLDLKPYYNSINIIDSSVNNLRMECRQDRVMLAQIDTISMLIEKNIVNWNKLLYLINNDNVVHFLKELSYQVNNKPEEKKKRGILRKVFSRNNPNQLNEEELINNFRKLESDKQKESENLKNRESQLAYSSARIKEELFDLIFVMENNVSEMVLQKGQEANKLAESTYVWLLLFSISGGLLTLAALFTIFRYLSNARKYQVALEQAKLEAESLARTKELFMANISHEIRTPVTAISGFTAQLLQDPLDGNTLQSLRIIKSSSDHLARIIDDILDFTKLQNGKLLLEEVHFNLDQILDEVVSLFEHQAKERKNNLLVSLSPETEHYLLGDPFRLKQILINLVSNAIKFTSFGTVVIAVNTEKSNNEQLKLELSVTDTGIGIDEDKLDIIFNEFTQAEMSITRKYGGTGLGLSIVKKILELQHGSIECESRKNFGTKITCHIPYQTGKEELALKSVSPSLSVPAWLSDISVLVVDDELFNRQLFQKIFQRWNIKCDLAESSMEAFELLKSTSYDILFMDVRMPGIDGLKAARFIRDNLNIGESVTKIICISAAIVKEEEDIGRIAGMNGILPKPFTEEMLFESVLTVLSTKLAIPGTDSATKRELLQKTTGRINLDSLKHIAGNDKEFVSQMIHSFILTTSNGLAEMEEALKLHNRGKVTEIAHKLTPPCRHIGAKELESLLKKIERTAIDDNFDQLEILLKKTVHEAENIFSLLREQQSIP